MKLALAILALVIAVLLLAGLVVVRRLLRALNRMERHLTQTPNGSPTKGSRARPR